MIKITETALFIILMFTNVLFAQNDENKIWSYSIRYVNVPFLNYKENVSERATIKGQLKKLDKVVTIEKNNNSEWVMVVYPVKGFVQSRYLYSIDESFAIQESEIAGGYKNSSKNNWVVEDAAIKGSSVKIFSGPADRYAIKNTMNSGDKILVLISNPVNNWYQVIYPAEGFIQNFDFGSSNSEWYLNLYLAYSPFDSPFEKSLSANTNSTGGYISVSGKNKPMEVGAGFNINEYTRNGVALKTQLFYLFDRFKVLDLTDFLYLHLNIGAVYYNSEINIVRNTGLSTNNYSRTVYGFGIMAGAGLMLKLDDFLINCQYNFVGTSEASFNFNPGVLTPPSNYSYNPGSNQIQIMLGYRINL